jgi:hypothetical protein
VWGTGTPKDIETRLIDERFESVMGECDLEAIGATSTFKVMTLGQNQGR